MAARSFLSESAGGASVDSCSERLSFLEENVGLCWPRFFGRRRLHGPGELGYGPGRRGEVWLHTALRNFDFKPDGNFVAALVHQAGHSYWPGFGAGLP